MSLNFPKRITCNESLKNPALLQHKSPLALILIMDSNSSAVAFCYRSRKTKSSIGSSYNSLLLTLINYFSCHPHYLHNLHF
ncbi:unnamed protein product [Moneuplotes crassus]|uniref:Uncharacterized protein n=1 Tax=Euplotes crassus TaxID=5936 RepID=A0AAD2D5A9_EUPCR|nr:unnamed protein product [Moneuplotes crassus]